MTKRRLILILGNAILTVVIGLVLWLPLPEINLSMPEGATSQTSRALPPLRSIPAPELDRSLFRKSSNDTQGDQMQETLSAPDIRLVGVVVSDDMRIVLIEEQDTSLRRLREGDDVDGWIVTNIEPRSVTLTGQSQVAVYPLDPGPVSSSPEGEISDDTNSQDAILKQSQDPI